MSVCARSDIPIITIIIKTISIGIQLLLYIYIIYYIGINMCVVLCVFKPVDYNIVFLF